MKSPWYDSKPVDVTKFQQYWLGEFDFDDTEYKAAVDAMISYYRMCDDFDAREPNPGIRSRHAIKCWGYFIGQRFKESIKKAAKNYVLGNYDQLVIKHTGVLPTLSDEELRDLNDLRKLSDKELQELNSRMRLL